MRAIKNFDTIFNLLYTKYFFKVIFKSIYLSNSKIYIFIDSLEMIKFIEGAKGLRSSTKHREKIMI